MTTYFYKNSLRDIWCTDAMVTVKMAAVKDGNRWQKRRNCNYFRKVSYCFMLSIVLFSRYVIQV